MIETTPDEFQEFYNDIDNCYEHLCDVLDDIIFMEPVEDRGVQNLYHSFEWACWTAEHLYSELSDRMVTLLLANPELYPEVVGELQTLEGEHQ